MSEVRSGPPTGNVNTNEQQKFVETRNGETAVRVIPKQEAPSTPGQNELAVNPFKPDPITVSLFQQIICELRLIRQHLEVVTGEKFRGD